MSQRKGRIIIVRPFGLKEKINLIDVRRIVECHRF